MFGHEAGPVTANKANRIRFTMDSNPKVAQKSLSNNMRF
jgi:hypothetical protein